MSPPASVPPVAPWTRSGEAIDPMELAKRKGGARTEAKSAIGWAGTRRRGIASGRSRMVGKMIMMIVRIGMDLNDHHLPEGEGNQRSWRHQDWWVVWWWWWWPWRLIGVI